jgi:hypothetical protein
MATNVCVLQKDEVAKVVSDIFKALFIIQARGPGADWLVPEPAWIRRTTNSG